MHATKTPDHPIPAATCGGETEDAMKIKHRATGTTIRGANLRDADLCCADLRDADLYCADLYCADLRDADLRGANLRGANLRDADLRDADLRDADLRGANLRAVDLQNADLRGAKLLVDPCANAEIYGSLYEYVGAAFVSADGTPWVRMGCLWKTVADWDAIGIEASNPSGFPADGSARSTIRAAAFRFLRERALWLAARHAPPANEGRG